MIVDFFKRLKRNQRGSNVAASVTDGEGSVDELEDEIEDDDDQLPRPSYTSSLAIVEQHMKAITASKEEEDKKDGDIADAEKVTRRFILCN